MTTTTTTTTNLATAGQVERLLLWRYPGDPTSLTVTEARDLIYAIYRWQSQHRDDDDCHAIVGDEWAFDEHRALGRFWVSQGDRMLQRIRHAHNLRRPDPHFVQTVGRWVQSLPLRLDLGCHTGPLHSDYRIAVGDDCGLKRYLSVWGDSRREVEERIARVQTILAGADPVAGLQQIWAEDWAEVRARDNAALARLRNRSGTTGSPVTEVVS